MSEATIGTAESTRWQATAAVVVYEAKNHSGGAAAHAYATLHQIEGNGAKMRLASGVPATKEACANLARALGAASTLTGFVPPQLLFLGARSLLWWRPPGRATVYFDTTKNAAADQADDKTGRALLGKRSGSAPHPGLVFAVTAGRWFVYALAGGDRPDGETRLRRAPYFNVYADGAICTGNVRLPDTLSTTALERYERAFFDSEFTHPNMGGGSRLVNHPGGAYALWRDLLRAPKSGGFPVGALVDVKLTVAGLAARLEKGERNG